MKQDYDVAVVGGGVVGCAIIRELTRYHLKVVLLERESDVARGASGKNSGVVHTGFNVPTGSVKAQLNVACKAMRDEGVPQIPAAGLAKQNEELYLPGRPAPILLPRDSQALYLLQRIRDEAHRFAITYHRKLRGKKSVRSLLDDVPGIGPLRRKALLAEFGSLKAIRQATLEQLAAVPGMTRRVAEQLLESL